MKKLLLLPLVLLLFVPSAFAREINFETTQYAELEQFVYTEIPAGPITEVERVRLEDRLLFLEERATTSIERLLDKELSLEFQKLQYTIQIDQFKADKKVAKNTQKIKNWLRKNKNKPGSQEKADRRLNRLHRNTDLWLDRRSEAHDMRYRYFERVNTLLADLQISRISKLSIEGYAAIERLDIISD